MKEEQIKVNVNLKIMPFGQVSIEIKSYERGKRKETKQAPVIYSEPETTDPEALEITFDGLEYTVPKTTTGVI